MSFPKGRNIQNPNDTKDAKEFMKKRHKMSKKKSLNRKRRTIKKQKNGAVRMILI